MKKFFICSFLNFLVCCSALHAQTAKPQSKIANQLLELLDHTKDGFKAIKGAVNKELTEKNKITKSTYYKTSYSLEGAIEKYIEETSYRSVIFKAYLGKNLTEAGGDDLFKKLHEQIKQGFASGFEVEKDFKNYDGDLYETVRVQRDNDDSHYIELTLVNADDMISTRIEVYITVK